MHESFTLTSILIDEEKSFKNQKKGVAEIRMMLWYGFILHVQYISEFFAMLNPITIVLIFVFYGAYMYVLVQPFWQICSNENIDYLYLYYPLQRVLTQYAYEASKLFCFSCNNYESL